MVDLIGVSATGVAGQILLPQSATVTLPSLSATSLPGTFTVQPHTSLQGAAVAGSAGRLTAQIAPALRTARAGLSVGTLLTIQAASGLAMSHLLANVQIDTTTDDSVNLRWSNTAGASWGSPVSRSLGKTGQFYTNLQWRRLGMGRNFIFELSWTAPTPEALTGAFIETSVSQT